MNQPHVPLPPSSLAIAPVNSQPCVSVPESTLAAATNTASTTEVIQNPQLNITVPLSASANIGDYPNELSPIPPPITSPIPSPSPAAIENVLDTTLRFDVAKSSSQSTTTAQVSSSLSTISASSQTTHSANVCVSALSSSHPPIPIFSSLSTTLTVSLPSTVVSASSPLIPSRASVLVANIPLRPPIMTPSLVQPRLPIVPNSGTQTDVPTSDQSTTRPILGRSPDVKYLISQIYPTLVAARKSWGGKSTDGWPELLAILDEDSLDFSYGDGLVFESFEEWSNPNPVPNGSLRVNHLGKEPQLISYQQDPKESEGVVVETNKISWKGFPVELLIQTHSTIMPTWVLSEKFYEVETMVRVKVKPISQGFQVGTRFMFPEAFPAPVALRRSGPESEMVIQVIAKAERFEFPSSNPTSSLAAQRTIATALAAQVYLQRVLQESTSVITQLELVQCAFPIPPKRGKIDPVPTSNPPHSSTVSNVDFDPDSLPTTSYQNTHQSKNAYRFELKCDLEYLDKFSKIWKRDSAVVARKEMSKPAFGQGNVRECTFQPPSVLNPQHTIQVTISLVPQGDLFDWFDSDEFVILEVPLSLSRLENRVKLWKAGIPSSIALHEIESPPVSSTIPTPIQPQSDHTNTNPTINQTQADTAVTPPPRKPSPRSIILRTLLGLSTSPPQLPTPDLTHAQFATSLIPKPNHEQLQTIDLTLNPTPAVLAAVAPPGTGKSDIIARAALHLSRGGERVNLIAHSNAAIARLAQDICPFLSGDERALIILSAVGKEKYLPLFLPFKRHLLISTIDELSMDKLNRRNKRILFRYKANALSAPRKADEKGSAQIAIGNLESMPKIIISTMSMGEDVPGLLTGFVFFLDEAGQAASSQLITLICLAPNVRKLFVTGDPAQLDVFLSELPTPLHEFGFGSILSHALGIPSSSRTSLTISYRAHPLITKCLSEAFYGSSISAGVFPQERSLLLSSGFPLTATNVPILLLDAPERDVRDPLSYSRFNPHQTRISSRVLLGLMNYLPRAVLLW